MANITDFDTTPPDKIAARHAVQYEVEKYNTAQAASANYFADAKAHFERTREKWIPGKDSKMLGSEADIAAWKGTIKQVGTTLENFFDLRIQKKGWNPLKFKPSDIKWSKNNNKEYKVAEKRNDLNTLLSNKRYDKTKGSSLRGLLSWSGRLMYQTLPSSFQGNLSHYDAEGSTNIGAFLFTVVTLRQNLNQKKHALFLIKKFIHRFELRKVYYYALDNFLFNNNNNDDFASYVLYNFQKEIFDTNDKNEVKLNHFKYLLTQIVGNVNIFNDANTLLSYNYINQTSHDDDYIKWFNETSLSFTSFGKLSDPKKILQDYSLWKVSNGDNNALWEKKKVFLQHTSEISDQLLYKKKNEWTNKDIAAMYLYLLQDISSVIVAYEAAFQSDAWVAYEQRGIISSFIDGLKFTFFSNEGLYGATEDTGLATGKQKGGISLSKTPTEKKEGVPDSSTSSGASAAADNSAAEAEARKAVLQAKIATANRLRLNEQAALMLNADYLIKKQSESKIKLNARNQLAYDNFIVVRNEDIQKSPDSTTPSINKEIGGGHIDITSILLKNNHTKYFLKNIPPNILSILTPSIKLYKVFYVDKSGKHPNAPGFPWRIPFDDVPYKFQRNDSNFPITTEFQDKTIQEILLGTGRFHNIGIKSFSYKYVGTNPAEVNTNIQAELQLYFQDVSDIVKTVRVNGDDPNFSPPLLTSPEKEPFNRNDIQFCYADLIADQPREEKINGRYIYNEKYFRIKAIVGYSTPPDHVLEKLCSGEEATYIKNAIESNKVAFYLTPVNHDLTFEENGSITLKIKYQAALTSILASINALEIAKDAYKNKRDLDAKLLETQELLRLEKKNSDSGENLSKAKKAYLKAKEEVSEFEIELENKKNEIYSEVFSRLVGLKTGEGVRQQFIYSADFPKEALGVQANGEIQSKSGFTPEILSNARAVTGFKISSWEGEESIADIVTNIKPSNITLDDPYEDIATLPAGDTYTTINSKELLDQLKLKDVPQDIIAKINSIFDKQNRVIKEINKGVTKENQKKLLEKPEIKDEKHTRNKKDKSGKEIKGKNGKPVTEEYTEKNYSNFFSRISEANLYLATNAASTTPKIELFKSNQIESPQVLKNQIALKEQQKRFEEHVGKTRIKPDSSGLFTVKFAFLGDIFDIFSELLYDKKIIADPVDIPRFILTDFYLSIPVEVRKNRMLYQKYNLNLADIPISIEMLKAFLLEKFIKPRVSSFSLVRMFLSIISDIVAPAVSPTYFGSKAVFNKVIRASTLTLCVPAKNKSGVEYDVVVDKPIDENFGGIVLKQAELSRILSDDENGFFKMLEQKKLLNYMVFYCSNQLPNSIKNNAGDTEADEKIGVYHFFVGASKGCLRRINFSRSDTPFYAEAKMVSSQGNKNINLRLREVFNATIEMHGNNIYRPGDFLYIEPLFYIGEKAIDLQTKIGLGGYYMIIDVDTKITEGSYVSILRLVFHATIETQGNKRKVVTAEEEQDDINDEESPNVTVPNANSPTNNVNGQTGAGTREGLTPQGFPAESPSAPQPQATDKDIKAFTKEQIEYIEKTLNIIADKKNKPKLKFTPDGKITDKQDKDIAKKLSVYITKSGKLADITTRNLIEDDGDVTPEQAQTAGGLYYKASAEEVAGFKKETRKKIQSRINSIASARNAKDYKKITEDGAIGKQTYAALDLLKIYITVDALLADVTSGKLVDDSGNIIQNSTANTANVPAGQSEPVATSNNGQAASSTVSAEAQEAGVAVPEVKVANKIERKQYIVNGIPKTTPDGKPVYIGDKDGEYLTINDSGEEIKYIPLSEPVVKEENRPPELKASKNIFEEIKSRNLIPLVLTRQEYKENLLRISYWKKSDPAEGATLNLDPEEYSSFLKWLNYEKIPYEERILYSLLTTPSSVVSALKIFEDKQKKLKEIYHVNSPPKIGFKISYYTGNAKNEYGELEFFYTHETLLMLKNFLPTIDRSDIEINIPPEVEYVPPKSIASAVVQQKDDIDQAVQTYKTAVEEGENRFIPFDTLVNDYRSGLNDSITETEYSDWNKLTIKKMKRYFIPKAFSDQIVQGIFDRYFIVPGFVPKKDPAKPQQSAAVVEPDKSQQPANETKLPPPSDSLTIKANGYTVSFVEGTRAKVEDVNIIKVKVMVQVTNPNISLVQFMTSISNDLAYSAGKIITANYAKTIFPEKKYTKDMASEDSGTRKASQADKTLIYNFYLIE